MKFGKAIQEWVYSLSTNDKYSEYDSTKSFNRVNKPRTETETNLLTHHQNTSNTFIGDSELQNYALDGIHEVRLAWRHIKMWLHNNSPDLNSSLQKPCTDDDLNDFQKDLTIKLPNCVIEFFKLTDGQYIDDFNKVGGLIFGLKLMSLDEIMVMTEDWRKVAKKITTEMSHSGIGVQSVPKTSKVSFNSTGLGIPLNNSTASLNISKSETSVDSSSYPTQKSMPPGYIHAIFAHPSWIPLITDEVGNCIGIDLSPPAKGPGKWGQVILFGREFDTKYLLADNLGDFLLIFANDLEKGNWEIKVPEKNNYGDLVMGNEGDLVFIDKETKLEANYLTVLKKRCISKWVESLDKENLSSETKLLIDELKKNPDSILNVKKLNEKSIDDFINNNLELMKESTLPVKESAAKPPAKQPSMKKSVDKPMPPIPQEIIAHDLNDNDTFDDTTI
ncbi:KNR4/SMI1 homolog 1 [[Candida] jaroonii]|uniref:KNR4/SMI1 homolog 1 n=1 Tax=[Candida] jaroonii TaxID=467808 RepID=A0ACA9Y496_9ASCO|nr:KNR4/SMI1 homolog 1 [[Candida] jaroonii]